VIMMVQARNINGSTKRIGRYEAKIIQSLTEYFQKKGYEVIPHARLNIAWGSILSDVDLLLLKKGALTYVEVKSRRDKLLKALKQIDRVKDYVDYAYVATDRLVKDWDIPKVGLIFVHGNIVTFVRESKRFTNGPSFSSIASLRKECLARFLENGRTCRTYIYKYDLARYVYEFKKDECTRECIKEIVACGTTCDTTCPIESFVKSN